MRDGRAAACAALACLAVWSKQHHSRLPAAGPAQALSFHIGDTTISFQLRAEEARKLSAALTAVMQASERCWMLADTLQLCQHCHCTWANQAVVCS